MNRTITAALSLLVFAAALLAAACGGDDDGGEPQGSSTGEPTAIEGVSTIPAFPVSVPRSDGETLAVSAPPARIVSLSAGATEILYAIGAESSLVAVDTTADFPEAVAAFSTRLDAAAPDAAAIASLEPDLVIVGANNGNIVQALDAQNIPVFFQDEAQIVTVSDVFTQIALLGRVTGKQMETDALLAALDTRVNGVTDAVQGLSQAAGPKVYHEVTPQLVTASEASLEGDLYRLVRARNIAGAGGGTAYPQLSPETIVAANPDVIVIASGSGAATPEAVGARAGWGDIVAVQESRTFMIDGAIVSRRGPRIVDALEQLGESLYPDRFE